MDVDVTLFSARSLQTMFHGILLSGGAVVGLAIALFSLLVMGPATGEPGPGVRQSRWVSAVLVFTALALWLVVISGTYVIFSPYRATPPAGAASLGPYPRALLLSNPNTAWLHAFAMECKEHMPWIAAMLTTAAAFVSTRHRSTVLSDVSLRPMMITLVSIAFALASFIGLLGIFVNKAAPLQ